MQERTGRHPGLNPHANAWSARAPSVLHVRRIQFGSIADETASVVAPLEALSCRFQAHPNLGWSNVSFDFEPLVGAKVGLQQNHRNHQRDLHQIPSTPAHISLASDHDTSIQSTSPPTSPKITPITPAAPVIKSWASIVKVHADLSAPKTPSTVPIVSAPSVASGFEKFFSTYQVSLTSRLIKPRGLINNGNMCFMNAILQPLLHCVTFYNLIKQLGLNVAYSFKTNTPLMDAFITFFNEFDEELPHQLSGKTKCRTASDAFEPVYVYDALWKKSNVDSIKGRQEDAEEFLGFLLDGLHEELLFVRRGGKPVVRPSSPDGLTSPTSSDVTGGSSSKDTSGDDAWVEVGRKNKTATTRTTEILETPIVQIFGGRTRSIIKAHGDKERVTLEPFQSLQLDIAPDHVASIDDALLNLTVPETITGVTSQNLGIAVDATKQTYIDVFPSVLILHLKRFVYDQSCGATRKLRKHVAFETRLKVRGDVVAPGARRAGQVVYTLFAVVNHHGKYAEGGHYTCDVYRNNEEWLRMDDENVEKVTVEDVVEEKEDRQAYMLFYAKS